MTAGSDGWVFWDRADESRGKWEPKEPPGLLRRWGGRGGLAGNDLAAPMWDSGGCTHHLAAPWLRGTMGLSPQGPGWRACPLTQAQTIREWGLVAWSRGSWTPWFKGDPIIPSPGTTPEPAALGSLVIPSPQCPPQSQPQLSPLLYTAPVLPYHLGRGLSHMLSCGGWGVLGVARVCRNVPLSPAASRCLRLQLLQFVPR